MVPATRVWIYVLSVAALLVPAGGIAYLGAVSYRDDRGAVRALQERQQQAALAVATRIGEAIDAALDEVERATALEPTEHRAAAAVTAPLGRFWFWLDAN
ncbi:MAG: hypothetical protein H0X17_10065, partial [Deltaproteobacteria bacterium]|nr:hypothetical protein [Deltaproteobacteria bacterium]